MMTFLVLLNLGLLVLLAVSWLVERDRAREFKAVCAEHSARIGRAADELEALRVDLENRVAEQLVAMEQQCASAIARVHAEADRVFTALRRDP